MSDTFAAPAPADDGRWWIAHPEEWERELISFDTMGLDVVTVEESDVGPIRRAQVSIPPRSWVLEDSRVEETGLTLTIEYPPEYPFFEPAVIDTNAVLSWADGHRTFDGQLCLAPSQLWSLNDSGGEFIARQLPLWLLAGDVERRAQLTEDELAELEDGSLGRPDMYWPTVAAHSILVDPACASDYAGGQDSGAMTVGFAADPRRADLPTGAVLSVAGHSGQARWAGKWQLSVFSWQVRGMWVRRPGAPIHLDQAGVEFVYRQLSQEREQHLAEAARISAGTATVTPLLAGSATESIDQVVDVLAWVWPDESRPGAPDRWTFFLAGRSAPDREWVVRLLLGDPAGPEVYRARAGQLQPKSGTHVSLVGAGAIGSTIAMHLARGGIDALTIIDGDCVSYGNLPRHVGTVIDIGATKASTVRTAAKLAAPDCAVGAIAVTIGANRYRNRTTVMRRSAALEQIAEADIVIDAGASPALTRFLAAAARAERHWFVHASATAGVWGGVVALLGPNDTDACWACVEYHRADGTLPVPPADPAGPAAVMPTGCSHPTFTGTLADTDTIASAASRLLLTLAAGTGNPHVSVCTLREPNTGQYQPATWASAPLAVHPRCNNHIR